MRKVPLKGSTTGSGRSINIAAAGSATCAIVKVPSIEPSGRRFTTAGERSTVPLNVPLITGKSGTWTTTSNVPLTGPVPVTVETLSVPVAMTVQLSRRGTETSSLDGQSGVPSAANPWSGEIAFLRITPATLGSGSKVTRSLTS